MFKAKLDCLECIECMVEGYLGCDGCRDHHVLGNPPQPPPCAQCCAATCSLFQFYLAVSQAKMARAAACEN